MMLTRDESIEYNIKHFGKKYGDKEKLHQIILYAVDGLAKELDSYFPGKERGGIDSNFCGEIQYLIYKYLRKRELIKEEDCL